MNEATFAFKMNCLYLFNITSNKNSELFVSRFHQLGKERQKNIEKEKCK